MTEADVRLQLAEEEAEQAKIGSPALHEVSPSAFILQGLELEEQQRSLKFDVKGKKFATAQQKATLIERRTKLTRAIGRFRSLQATYMPVALLLLSKRREEMAGKTSDGTTEEKAEDIPLFLPSEVPEDVRGSGCLAGIDEIERKFQDAQLRNALNSLRNHLHMKSRLLTYRTTNVAHQGAVSRSKTLFLRNQRQIDGDAAKYQDAWKAMGRLVGSDMVKWRKLAPKDIWMMDGGEDRALGNARKKVSDRKKRRQGEDTEAGLPGERNEAARSLTNARKSVGEGHCEVSWIWMEGGTGEAVDNKALEEIIRVEWCKAYARAKRWEEEVDLLKEEMRRCLVTLEWNAWQWEARAMYEGPLAQETDDLHKEGVAAYAHNQAALFRAIKTRFTCLWNDIDVKRSRIEDKVLRREAEGATEEECSGEGNEELEAGIPSADAEEDDLDDGDDEGALEEVPEDM